MSILKTAFIVLNPSSRRTQIPLTRANRWNVEARPLTEKAGASYVGRSVGRRNRGGTAWTGTLFFTVYRAQGGKEKTPPDSDFQKVAENLTVTRYIDRRVTKDNTYWYTVTTQVDASETRRIAAVAATPRETTAISSCRLSPSRKRDARFTS